MERQAKTARTRNQFVRRETGSADDTREPPKKKNTAEKNERRKAGEENPRSVCCVGLILPAWPKEMLV